MDTETETAGKPQKKTIVAIHGAGMHAGAWGPVVPHLLDYYFRAISLPGHNMEVDSGDPLPTIDAMADWLRARLDKSGGDNILIGHSMGSLVAMAAADHPSVSAIVLVSSARALAVNDELLTMAAERPQEAADQIVKWGIYKNNPHIDAVKTVVASIMHGTNPRAVGTDLRACNSFIDMDKLARRLSKPALLLAGADDKMVRSSETKSLSAIMQNARYVELPECGHMVMIEKPIETAREINAFIKSQAF